MLAKEGIFCEPASAASVAGLIKNNEAKFSKNIEPSLKNITKILGY